MAGRVEHRAVPAYGDGGVGLLEFADRVVDADLRAVKVMAFFLLELKNRTTLLMRFIWNMIQKFVL
jgi:hypothetical protein